MFLLADQIIVLMFLSVGVQLFDMDTRVATSPEFVTEITHLCTANTVFRLTTAGVPGKATMSE